MQQRKCLRIDVNLTEIEGKEGRKDDPCEIVPEADVVRCGKTKSSSQSLPDKLGVVITRTSKKAHFPDADPDSGTDHRPCFMPFLGVVIGNSTARRVD